VKRDKSSSAPTELVAALAQLLDQLPVKGAGAGVGSDLTQTDLTQQQQTVSAAQQGATPSTKPAAAQDEPGPLDDQHHRLHPPDQPAALSTGPAANSVASESTSQAAFAQTAPSDLPLAALLDQMQALQLQLSLSQAERHSIKLLSDQVEELKGQLQLAQQQRDQAQGQLQQVANLHQENIELKAQLHDAQHRLDLFLNLAHGLPMPMRAAEQAAPASPGATAELPDPVQTEALASSPPPAVAPLSPAHPVARPQQQQLQQPIRPTPISNQPPATPPLPSFDEAQIKALAAGLSPDDRISLAIQALVEFNQQCSQTKDRWTITGNVIAAMTGTNAATRVNPWLDIHPDVGRMIHQHNQEMGIDSNYHNRGKGKDKAQLRQILAW
jgi:hypothetical protein